MKHYESALQIQCVKWFRLQYPKEVIFAIPNARKVGIRMGGILKAEGVTAGVADLFIMAPGLSDKGQEIDVFYGLFIEMKYGVGKQSPEQKAFQKHCERKGYKYVVCRTIEEFINEVTNYLL